MLYITPLRWSISALVKADFHGSVFGGAILSNSTAGYICVEQLGPCYGRTGEQVTLVCN